MWNCQTCGCQAIAASLTRCPMCEEEREVPKITNSGPSNAAAEVVDETRDDLPVVEEVEPDPEAAKQKAREARAALKDGNPEQAAALLDEAAELHPERAEYFAGLKQKVTESAEGEKSD